jgi:dUTP pyrophosphatase
MTYTNNNQVINDVIISKKNHLNPTINLKIINQKLLDTPEFFPAYATSGSAGIDLRAALDTPLTLKSGETILVPSGFAVHIKDPNLAGFIFPRSGLGHKNGIVLGNLTGVIDSDYQGEIKISLWNRSNTDYTIEAFDRVAQLVFLPVAHAQLNLVAQFEESQRGAGGFGSTGIR